MKRDINLVINPSSKGRRTRLWNLLERPLPPLRLRSSAKMTLQTSGHKPIEREINDQELNIIEGLMEFLKDKFEDVDSPSMFLNKVYNYTGENRNWYFESATAVVGDLLNDIISLLTMEDKVFATQEDFVPHARYFGRDGDKSDIWLICRELDNNRQPMLVVAVKSPDVGDILNNECVAGQICDYMIDIASFYGQRDVFGITTTGKEWKFHWFPSCDVAAKSTEIIPEELRSQILNEPLPTLSRVVCSTSKISQENPLLVPLLLSVLLKSAFSPVYKVPFISTNRMYITLSEDSWSWSILKSTMTANLDKLTIDINQPVDISDEFVVLNHLARNRDQLVWIAVAGDSSRLVVIKQYPPEFSAKADIEQSIWQTVNQAHSLIRTVRGLRSLIMPLVFHARFDDKGGVPYFDCDLRSWLFPTGSIAEELPESLDSLRNNMMGAAKRWEHLVIEAAKQAVKDLASHKIVHEDIQWRHFSLMPRFNKGEFYELTPIMIDFSYSHRVETALEASTAMMKQLDELISKMNVATTGGT